MDFTPLSCSFTLNVLSQREPGLSGPTGPTPSFPLWKKSSEGGPRPEPPDLHGPTGRTPTGPRGGAHTCRTEQLLALLARLTPGEEKTLSGALLTQNRSVTEGHRGVGLDAGQTRWTQVGGRQLMGNTQQHTPLQGRHLCGTDSVSHYPPQGS